MDLRIFSSTNSRSVSWSGEAMHLAPPAILMGSEFTTPMRLRTSGTPAQSGCRSTTESPRRNDISPAERRSGIPFSQNPPRRNRFPHVILPEEAHGLRKLRPARRLNRARCYSPWGHDKIIRTRLLRLYPSIFLRLQPALEDLVGVGIAGAGDPDLVIGKDSVAIRQSHLRHMTSDAVVPRDTAGLLRIRRMTCQASAIVTGFVPIQVGMRIVAGGATDPFVIAEETVTIRQAVRRKPDIDLAPLPRPDDELPCAMALAAELRHVFGAHLAEFRGKRRDLAPRYGFHVSGHARVAMLASDARLE